MEVQAKTKVVAVDGPCGGGKSTITKLLAHTMGIIYVDTGAMFRAIGYKCHELKIDFSENEALKKFLENLKLSYAESPDVLVRINGEDLTNKIREHHVSELASKISRIVSVRNFLLNFQRSLAVDRVCIMEGRDIGTVIFPNAFCKIFLTASADVRAQRRYEELIAKNEKNISFEQVLKDLNERDYQDMNRSVAPLAQAKDAVLFDTSDLKKDEVVNEMKRIITESAKKYGVKI